MRFIIIFAFTLGCVLLNDTKCFSQSEPDSTSFVTEIDGLKLLGVPQTNTDTSENKESSGENSEKNEPEIGVITNKDEE